MTDSNPQKEEIRDALSDSDLFGSLFDEEIEQLIGFGTIQRFREGQTIFLRGDPGDCLMIVVSGRVKISNVSVDGKEAVLNFIEPANCFGEIAMLDGKERSADASAYESCELFVLRNADMLRFIEKYPDVVWRVMGVLCAKLRRTTEMVEDSVLLTMEPRIARAILRLIRDYGRKSGNDVRIDLRLSQRELGNYVGLARENINRHLRNWRQQGLISMDGGHIVVHNVKGVEAIASG